MGEMGTVAIERAWRLADATGSECAG